MRYFFRFCLLTGALVAPAAAATLSGQAGACQAKGARGTAVGTATSTQGTSAASATTRAPYQPAIPSAAAAKPSPKMQAWLVITPRLADPAYQPYGTEHGPRHPVETALANCGQTLEAGSSRVLTTIGKPAVRLARVTAYWRCEGDYYTRRGIAATGVRLHDGHCAVDPTIIPYGSVVNVAGVGSFLAVDTGSAVISRTAARQGGHTSAERNAIVIDLYFADRMAGERFASRDAKWTAVNWWTPGSTASQAREARSLFAAEDWTKIHDKQL